MVPSVYMGGHVVKKVCFSSLSSSWRGAVIKGDLYMFVSINFCSCLHHDGWDVWPSGLVRRLVHFDRQSLIQIPVACDNHFVRPLQRCLNPVCQKVFPRCPPVYSGTTSATIRCASPEVFYEK